MSSWGDRWQVQILREALILIANGGIDIEQAREIAKEALRK